MAKEEKTVRVYDEKRKQWMDARVCHICGGHEAVTVEPTPEECDGHVGLKEHLRPFA